MTQWDTGNMPASFDSALLPYGINTGLAGKIQPHYVSRSQDNTDTNN